MLDNKKSGDFERSQLYREEFAFIFSRKGSGVRRTMVISALIEGQIFSLASRFLKERGVTHNPESNQEYNQSLNILKSNNILTFEELDKIQKFRKERNKSFHRIFRDMTRFEWDQQNRRVIELGRPVARELDKKLYNGKRP